MSAGFGAAEVFRLFGSVEVGRDKFEGDMDSMDARVHKFTQRLGSAFTKVGKTMTMGLTLPLVAAGAAAIKVGTDFNEGMANIATLIPGSTARVLELKEAVKGLSVETGKSLGDLTEGLYQVISAFGDTAETEANLNTVTRAGVAGRAATTDALNLLSAVTKGYGDTSAAALEKVADLAFATVRMGQTTFPELASSMGRVISIAQAMSISQEELFAVMATGTGVTGNASEVATQFRGVLNALMNPQKQMIELLKEHGYASGQAMLADLGLSGALKLIADDAKAGGFQMIEYISQVEALPLALALTGAQADTFTEKLEGMTQASGEAAAAFKEQTEGINETGFTMAQFRQQVIVLMTELGDGLAPTLRDVLKAIGPLLEGLRSLSPETKLWGLRIAAVFAAIGPLLIVLGKLVLIFPAIRLGILSLTAALMTPAGLIVTILALVAAIYAGAAAWKAYARAAEDARVAAEAARLGAAAAGAAQALASWLAAEESLRAYRQQKGGPSIWPAEMVSELKRLEDQAARAKAAYLPLIAATKAIEIVSGTAAAAMTSGGTATAKFTTRVDQAREAVERFQTELSGLTKGTPAYIAATADLAEAQKVLHGLLVAGVDDWAGYELALDNVDAMWKRMTDTVITATDVYKAALADELAPGMENVDEIVGAFTETVEDMWQRMEANADGTNRWADELRDLQKAMVDVDTQAARTFAQRAGIDVGGLLASMTPDPILQALLDALDKYYADLRNKAKAAADDIARIWQHTGDRIQDVWGDTIYLMISGAEEIPEWTDLVWDAILRSFSQMVAQMITQWLMLEQLMSSPGTWLGGVLGAIGGIFGLQGGAVVTGPTMAMLAEGGVPEVVIPLDQPAALAAVAAAAGVAPGAGAGYGSQIIFSEGAFRFSLAGMSAWDHHQLGLIMKSIISELLQDEAAIMPAW